MGRGKGKTKESRYFSPFSSQIFNLKSRITDINQDSLRVSVTMANDAKYIWQSEPDLLQERFERG